MRLSKSVWISVALVLIATLRIAATYSQLSYTFDEPAHIAAGMQWIEKGVYRYEAQHPPLARIMTAVLPWIDGAHGTGNAYMYEEGVAILAGQGTLDRTLALARAGTLPSFWITCAVVFLLTRWITRSGGAPALAVFLLTMTPSILAHFGLATTDGALTAMLLLVVYTGWRWLEEPTRLRAVWLGFAMAGAVLSKFSSLPFLAAIAAIALVGRWWFGRMGTDSLFPQKGGRVSSFRAAQLALAFGLGAILIWAGYRFSFGPIRGYSFWVPAPDLVEGISQVLAHNKAGHLSFLMGGVSMTGWHEFYLIALGVKTPPVLMVLGLLGLVLMSVPKVFGIRAWIVPSLVLGIVGFSSIFSRIQIGTRHVLPVFAALAISGACACLWLLRRFPNQTWVRYALGIALAGFAVTSFAAHPDYLGYFNVLAGAKPENILVDSDLDWGQDHKRLGQRLRELGAKEVYFNQIGVGDMEALYGFPPVHPLDLNAPQPGWNAVGLTALRLGRSGPKRIAYKPGFQFWPDRKQPFERIGTGVLLYYQDAK